MLNRQTPVISDFTAGELGPSLYSRTDREVYYKGAAKMQNVVPRPQGGFRMRPGTPYLGHSKSDGAAWCFKLSVSRATSYILEFGNNYIRIWKNDAYTSVEIATTYTAAEIPFLQFAWLTPDLFITHRSHPPARLRWTTPDTITLSNIVFTGNAGAIPFQSAGNYPRCCGGGIQSVWFASTANDPRSVWRSRVGIYDLTDQVDMTYFTTVTYTVQVMVVDGAGLPILDGAGLPYYNPSTQTKDVVADDDAFTFILATNDGEEIEWICEGRDLFIGSQNGEYVLPAGSTANDYGAVKVSGNGSDPVQAHFVSGGILFAQQGGQKLGQIDWQGFDNEYVEPDDLNFFADHLFMTYKISEIVVKKVPNIEVWVRRSDNSFVILYFSKKYQLQAWTTYVTDGTILSACCLPSTTVDTIYMFVQRGAFVLLEKVAPIDWTSIQTAVFLDSAVYTAGAAFTSVSGLGHLEGKIVDVVADGGWASKQTVATGAVLLEDPKIDRGNCESTTPPMIDGETVASPEIPVTASFARDATHPHAGTYDYLFTKLNAVGTAGIFNLTDSVLVNDMHSFVAGGIYNIDFWAYMVAGGITGTECALVLSEYYSGAWHETAFACANTYNAAQEITGTITLNALTAGVRLYFRAASTAVLNETFYVDDISITRAAVKAVVGLYYQPIVDTLEIEAAANYGSAQMKIKSIPSVALRLRNTMALKASYNTTATPEAVSLGGLSHRTANATPFTGDETVTLVGTHGKAMVRITTDYPLPFEVTAMVPKVVAAE